MRRVHAGRGRGQRQTLLPLLLFLVTVASTGCMTNSGSETPVATDTVRIPGPWVFTPEVIEVTNGTNVTWTNDGGQPHTVTFEELGHDVTIGPDESITLPFLRPGAYTYVCRFHPPDMVGKVIVREANLERTEP